MSSSTWVQVPVPLKVFQLNSKFDQISECSGLRYTQLIIKKFWAHHDSVTVVTCTKFGCDRPIILWTRALQNFIEFQIQSNYLWDGSQVMVCHQAIIWTDAGIWLIGPLGTNFSEILIEIHTVSSKKMCLKMPSAKWRPFCLNLNVLRSIHEVRELLLWCTIIWFIYVNNPASSEWNSFTILY